MNAHEQLVHAKIIKIHFRNSLSNILRISRDSIRLSHIRNAKPRQSLQIWLGVTETLVNNIVNTIIFCYKQTLIILELVESLDVAR